MSGARSRQQRRRTFDQNVLAASGRLAGRVEEDVPFCYMCDAAEGSRAKEHVFPRWLQRHHQAENELFTVQRVRSLTGELLSDRGTIPARALLAGEVCTTCNNGWMSALEVQAQRLLITPAPAGVIELEDARTLARWFTKIAVCLNVSQPYRLCFNQRTRHAIKDDVPPRVTVLLSRTASPNGVFDWIQRSPSGWLIPADEPVAIPLREVSYIAHIQIGDLVGTVLHLPEELGSYQPQMADASVLWPYESGTSWDTLPVNRDLIVDFVLAKPA